MDWKRILTYISGSVNEELLSRVEYLVTENRILRGRIKARLLLAAWGTGLTEIRGITALLVATQSICFSRQVGFVTPAGAEMEAIEIRPLISAPKKKRAGRQMIKKKEA